MTESTAPVSFRQKILSKEIKRAHAMQVRYEDIYVEPEFNLRTPLELLEGEELDNALADDQALFEHIMAGGKLPPLEVRPRAEVGVWLVDGHRRHEQIGRAIAAGAPLQDEDGIVWVDVAAFVGNDADRTARIISSAKGRHLRPLEVAFGYAKLESFRWDIDRIARLDNVSPQWVAKMLSLAHANSDVHALVRSGAVKASTAIDTIAKHGEGAGAFLADKFDQAKAAGKSKVTASAIHGRALPRKVVSPLISGVDAFIKGLDAEQRATLVDIQKGRVAHQTITVHATAVLDLFQAHCAVEITRVKQANKQRHAAETAAAAGQASIPEGENTA
ncbi:ParB/RepB/Spo0J family partition protein [Achromobacter kerstersii]